MELFQEIITYLIIAWAAGYTIYQFVKITFLTRNKNTGCTGCNGGCGIKELKHS